VKHNDTQRHYTNALSEAPLKQSYTATLTTYFSNPVTPNIADRMNSSPFARLAPELRNQIYELVLRGDEPFSIVCEAFNEGPRQDRDEQQPVPLALPSTCKQMHEECAQLLYSINTFRLRSTSPYHPTTILHIFQDAIGERNASALRTSILCGVGHSCISMPLEHRDHVVDPRLGLLLLRISEEVDEQPLCTIKVVCGTEYGRSSGPRWVQTIIPLELRFTGSERLWDVTFQYLRDLIRTAETPISGQMRRRIFDLLLGYRHMLGDHSEVELPVAK